jgi:CMP-N,N'-diacetyllegionaminic acid synthase
MIVAIVTARANSKGLPGKNMLPLCGKPLIQHSYDAAVNSGVFDKIILSTDLDAAIHLAKTYSQIEVPFKRPEYLCGDQVSQLDVVNHVLDYLESHKFNATHFVLLQPTSPFRTSNEIQEGVKLLRSGHDSVIGVTKVMHHPADYLFLGENNKLNYLLPEFVSKPRQTFPPIYFNNGGFYGCSFSFFKKNQTFVSQESALLIMNEKSLIDIDTMFDYQLAQGLCGSACPP